MLVADVQLSAAVITPKGGTVLFVRKDNAFYAITLGEPAFEPVNPQDAINGPVVFTPEMREALGNMHSAHETRRYAYQTVESTVLLFVYRVVEQWSASDEITFQMVKCALERYYTDFLQKHYPIAEGGEYYWAKALADAWHTLKQQLGQ